MSWLSDLKVRILGDNKSLKDSLNDSERSVSKFGTVLKRLGTAIVAAFTIGAIVSFSKAVINASEILSDKFSFAVAGAKGAVAEFFRMIASGDFSNFFANLSEGYTKATKLAQALDAFADKKAYLEYLLSGKKIESAEAERIVRDQSGQYNLDTRKQYAQKLKLIEKEIQDMTVEIAQETFGFEAQAWENRNKMSVDQAKKLYEDVAKISKEKQDAVFAEYEKFIKKFGKAQFLQSGGEVAGIFKPQTDALKRYYDLMIQGESEIIPKLFKSFQSFGEAKTTAQERFNSVLRITNTLLKEQGGKVSPIAKVEAPAIGSVQAGAKNEIWELWAKFLTEGGEGLQKSNIKLDREVTKMEKILTAGRDMAVDLGGQILEGLGEAMGGGQIKDIGKGLLLSLANFLSQFGKLLITLGLGLEAFAKSLATMDPIIAVAAGAAMLVAAGAIRGLISGGARQFSGGGGGGYGGGGAMQVQNVKVEVFGKTNIKGRDLEIIWTRHVDANN